MTNRLNPLTSQSKPLTPADCDLRDFAFMPLDVLRLRDSDLAIQTTGEEFRCAVLLWCASWHQVPAASLPDDDATLSSLAGFGRAVTEWLKVRDGALRGWIRCDDGRLYHPVVAEKACDAWQAKLVQRWKTELSRVKKHNQRHKTNVVGPDFDEWVSLGCPQGQMLPVPKDKSHKPQGQPPYVPEDTPPDDEGHPPNVPRETHSKGQGEGQGQYLKDKAAAINTSTTMAPVDNSPPPLPEPDGDSQKPNDGCTPARCAVLLTRWERDRGKACEIPSADPRLAEWADKRITVEQLRAAYDLAVADREADEDPSPVNAGFVGVFLAKVLRPSKKRNREPPEVVLPWPCRWSTIVAKGAEHGIEQGPDETPPEFKARVFTAAGLTEADRVQILADYGVRV